MTHDIPELDGKGLRDFGLMFGGFFAGLFGLLFPWIGEYSYPIWPWVLAAVMLIWSLTAPMSINPLYRVWMRIGMFIGGIVTRVILAIVFYGVVFPIGILMRRVGKDPMARKLDRDAKTYRIKSDPPSKENMERPF